jgi:hypothetical protein
LEVISPQQFILVCKIKAAAVYSPLNSVEFLIYLLFVYRGGGGGIKMQGRIIDVRPKIREGKLKVVARVRTKDWGTLDAYLPDRELSAILPRNILLGDSRKVPRKFLKNVSPIIKRMISGRDVRVWRYDEDYYFSFFSWRSIRFSA